MRLISLLWGAALSSCVGAFIVPDQLVSLLTVVYSVIPPIKKGSDSRVGFGYRFGPFADFQVLLELGPQTETQPIGGQTATSGKRDADADPAKRPDIQLLDAPVDVPLDAPPDNTADNPDALQQVAPSSNSRSARSRSSAASAAPAPPPAPPQQPAVHSDWLSRWRSAVSAPAVPPPAPPPAMTARLYRVESRPRPVRAPAPGPRAAPRPGPQSRVMSPDARWEAMRRLRSLHWAGQQNQQGLRGLQGR